MIIEYGGEIFEMIKNDDGSTSVTRHDKDTGFSITIECAAESDSTVSEQIISTMSDIYISHRAKQEVKKRTKG